MITTNRSTPSAKSEYHFSRMIRPVAMSIPATTSFLSQISLQERQSEPPTKGVQVEKGEDHFRFGFNNMTANRQKKTAACFNTDSLAPTQAHEDSPPPPPSSQILHNSSFWCYYIICVSILVFLGLRFNHINENSSSNWCYCCFS